MVASLEGVLDILLYLQILMVKRMRIIINIKNAFINLLIIDGKCLVKINIDFFYI